MEINKKNLYIAIFIFILLNILSFSNAATITLDSTNNSLTKSKSYDENSILKQIQEKIKEKNAKWTANITTISSYSEEELRNILNAVPDAPDKTTDNDKREKKTDNLELPDSFDWRDVNGTNYITSVKNQGTCGACVAFAFIGVLESVVQINSNNTFNCDLSEADLFFCSGGSCDYGVFPWDTLDHLETYGVTDEYCFPYKDTDLNCQFKCPDWEVRSVKVNSSDFVSYSDMKEALIKYGPLFTCFTVYQDFLYYESGIYEPLWGAQLGTHCTVIVGYNDTEEYWICKNSWGPNWGENGFFRIKYRKCGIDTDARYLTVSKSNPPTTPAMIDGPKTGQAGTQYYFRTVSEDPDDNAIYYIFDWGDGTSYEIIPPHTSGETINVSHIWSVKDQGIFNVRVKAMDIYGYESNWSQSTTIFIHNNPPDKPSKPEGPNRIRPREETTYTTFVNDSNGDPVYYMWDWGDNSDQEWLGPVNSGENISSSHTWYKRSKFVIKVKTKDIHGAESEWSEPLTIWGSKAKTNIFKNYLSVYDRLLQFLESLKNINT